MNWTGLPGRLAGVVLAAFLTGCAGRGPAPPAPTPGGELAVPTWSVRVYAGESAARAEDVASDARRQLDAPVRVMERGGEFHVLVGDFRTVEEAREFLAVARERGYRSARVAPW